jgi:hypothetical protein
VPASEDPKRVWDSFQLYKKLIGPLREKARELGYALAAHGTLKRDIDLIACPWTSEAVDARTLAEALFKVVGEVHGTAHWSWYPARGQEFTLNGGPGIKPHGRCGWIINLTMESGPYIDLAVMPRGQMEMILATGIAAQREPMASYVGGQEVT